MSFTSDKLRSLVRKWQSTIEAHIDVRTLDGYLVRLFAIAFTKRRPSQVKKTTYAKSSQIREIRGKMFDIMSREASNCDLKELFQKFVPEVIGREIEKASQGIYPLQNVYVRKVRSPRLSLRVDFGKLILERYTVQDPEIAAVRRLEAPRAPRRDGQRGDGHQGRGRIQGARGPRVRLNGPSAALAVVGSCIVYSHCPRIRSRAEVLSLAD